MGAGIQLAYLEGTFKFGPAQAGNFFYKGDDFGVGWTAGIMLQPARGTRIGIGYRSEIEYNLEGTFGDNILNRRFDADAQLTTPDVVTVSLQQEITKRFRFMATYEWTNWEDFDQLDIVSRQGGVATALAGAANTLPTGGVSVGGQNFASLEANWDNGWFASIGLEFDYTPSMTFRAGIAYEKSPIRNASQRLTVVPDNDR